MGLPRTERPPELAKRIAAVADFVHKRMMGDYPVDEFGFDPHLNNAIVLPLLRVFFNSWFRVEVSGIENLPESGPALWRPNWRVPWSDDVGRRARQASHRDLRLLAAEDGVRHADDRSGRPQGGPHDGVHGRRARLLAAGDHRRVPRGVQGRGQAVPRPLPAQRFAAAGSSRRRSRRRADRPVAVVGSEEIYPLVGTCVLARLFGLPYFPITPRSRGRSVLRGPAPSKWVVQFGEPIDTSDYDESAITFELTDQVRETIQQTLDAAGESPQHVPGLATQASPSNELRQGSVAPGGDLGDFVGLVVGGGLAHHRDDAGDHRLAVVVGLLRISVSTAPCD